MYKWCVTGTPFEKFDDKIFIDQIKFLISSDELNRQKEI